MVIRHLSDFEFLTKPIAEAVDVRINTFTYETSAGHTAKEFAIEFQITGTLEGISFVSGTGKSHVLIMQYFSEANTEEALLKKMFSEAYFFSMDEKDVPNFVNKIVPKITANDKQKEMYTALLQDGLTSDLQSDFFSNVFFKMLFIRLQKNKLLKQLRKKGLSDFFRQCQEIQKQEFE